MAEYTLDIGPVQDYFTWNADDMDEIIYPDGTYDSTTGTFYGIRTTARLSFLGMDITGGDADDPLVLNNNVPIKWKTTAGNKRHMLKLTSSDIFNIGSDDADGANEIRFDVEGVANIFKITPTGMFGNSYPFYADGAAGSSRSYRISTSGVIRWAIGGDNTAESGSDAGTNWFISAYSDAGAFIDTPMSINRLSGGAVTFNRDVYLAAASGNRDLYIQSVAGVSRRIIYRTSTSPRFTAGLTTDAETGGDAGSLYAISAYSDAGSLIDTPFTINRVSTGNITITRNLYVSAESGGRSIKITSVAGTYRYLQMLTGSTARWALVCGAETESGSNAGSVFGIYAYNDAGAYSDTPISITRPSTGVVTIARDLFVSASSGTRTLYIQSVAGTSRRLIYRTGPSARWAVDCGSNAESGSDAGSPYLISAYTDAAAFIDSPLTINRAAGGNFTVARPFNLNSTSTTADMLTSRATLNFFTGTVTTLTALQALTSGSWGATTGSTRFRHDVKVGDGSGAQFIYLDGGAANRDLEWQNNASARWRMRSDSSENFYLYQSSDGSTFAQILKVGTDKYGYFGSSELWAWDDVGRIKQRNFDEDVTAFFRDDFYRATTDYSVDPFWKQYTVGSGVVVANVSKGGKVLLQGEASSDWAAIFLQNDTAGYGATKIESGRYPIILEFRAYHDNAGQVLFGLISDPTSRFGCYFYESGGTDWYCQTYNGSATTTFLSGVSSASAKKLKIVVESSSSVKFYVDDVLKATHTTNIYTSNTLTPAFMCDGGGGTDNAYIDYVKFQQVRV